ncbi:hypothetical protein JMJ35_008146 [Cladonia borealis]|uniref:BTB domain-containing protein n=1 Tax=Cladonia borealis TaxID=184061 RepID=A0AA39QV03_9LECA|nr:hypothetical protein JMJ35_008146 [Cladonia borealis]
MALINIDDDIHKSGIVTGLQNLLSSSQYSDMIIRSGSEEFKVHRAIICPRSKFFAAACNGLFQEGNTGIVTLQDDDTPTVRRMLNYLYSLDYDDNGEAASVANYTHDKGASENLLATTVTEEQHLSAHDAPEYPELLNNIAVYAIADKYGIPELEVLAARKFEIALNDTDFRLDLASLPAIVDAVFDTTPETKCGLRNSVIEYCKSWKEYIIENEDSAVIVRDHGEIGLAMIHQVIHERDQAERSRWDQAEGASVREGTLMSHIDRISRFARCMKVSNSREVQQSYIDAQHRRLKDLRDAIQEAKDCFNTEQSDSWSQL